MKKNTQTNRYQFLQKEEAWIIPALVEIEKTKKPIADETIIIDLMNKSLFIEEADPFIDTFETFAKITSKYDIEGMPSSMMGFTTDAPFSHYTGPGDGNHFRLMKNGEEGFEELKGNRQKKRVTALEKAAAGYDDPADILKAVVYTKRIMELEARLLVLESQPTITPTVDIGHSFDNLEQFLEAPNQTSKIQVLRQRMKEARARDKEFMNTPMRTH